MNTKMIQKQLEYCKNKIERLNALFKLPENIIKVNFNILDIDLIIKELTHIKEFLRKDLRNYPEDYQIKKLQREADNKHDEPLGFNGGEL